MGNKNKTIQELVAEYCQLPQVINNLIYINNTDCFCEYQESKGYFKMLEERDLSIKIYNFLCINLKRNLSDYMVKDFIKQMKYRIYRSAEDMISPYLALRDQKILNTDTFLLEPAGTDKLAFSYIDCDPKLLLEADGEMPPVFKRFIEEVLVTEDLEADKELINLVQEMMGYYIMPTLESHASFFLVGSGGNGKSVMLSVIDKMIGDEFVENMSIEKLTTNNFATSNLVGKKVNICSEEESRYIKSDRFKALVSGDKMQVERKFGSSFSWMPTVKYIFATNEIPTFSGFNKGLLRRIFIIPFWREIKRSEIDTQLTIKLYREIGGILAWAVEGAKRLRQNRFQFSESEQSKVQIDKFQENISAAILFFNEQYKVVKEDEPEEFISNDELYDNYVIWCERRGKKKQSYYSFNKDLDMNDIKTIEKTEDGLYMPGRNIKRKYGTAIFDPETPAEL